MQHPQQFHQAPIIPNGSSHFDSSVSQPQLQPQQQLIQQSAGKMFAPTLNTMTSNIPSQQLPPPLQPTQSMSMGPAPVMSQQVHTIMPPNQQMPPGHLRHGQLINGGTSSHSSRNASPTPNNLHSPSKPMVGNNNLSGSSQHLPGLTAPSLNVSTPNLTAPQRNIMPGGVVQDQQSLSNSFQNLTVRPFVAPNNNNISGLMPGRTPSNIRNPLLSAPSSNMSQQLNIVPPAVAPLQPPPTATATVMGTVTPTSTTIAPPILGFGASGQQKRPMYPNVTSSMQYQQLQQQPPPNGMASNTMINGHHQQQPSPLQYQTQQPQPPPQFNQQQLQQNMSQYQPQQQQQLPQQLQQQLPQQPQQQQQQQYQFQPLNNQVPPAAVNNNPISVTHSGFNRLWGNNTLDLMQHRHVLPVDKVQPPDIKLNHQFHESVNCHPDVFRCTLTKVPESNSLLQKSRLPLGVLIHPFRDLSNLPVIQCSTIVRCRACRTYINPFVYFVDSKKWKCNLCYRVNELPDEFQYDPVSKTYGDVTRRPEVKSSTIEFIAPSEYMLRPPQPAIYLFLFDVSQLAVQSGYLAVVCSKLIEHLEDLPGDARTQVGFIAFNSALHFYSIAEGYNQPHEITVVDIDDVFLPCPDNLLINLKECKEMIKDLLVQLPTRFESSHDSKSALGAAMQTAYKMMSASGGRVTVFQTCLPNAGPGALNAREDPNNRSAKDVAHLGPATDFYKRLALECSGQQISVDLFVLNSQYCDLATLSGVSQFSGGCVHHIPLFNIAKPQQVETFRKSLERYLTRKIGFEAVMRVRCTRGLAIHTFHGNFFVRSTDLLSLPNVNPDAGFGMQITYEENLSDIQTVCFQAALLYTSSKGERRIRVHTLCLPVTSNLTDVMYSADVQCIIGLLSKMAVDRSLQSSVSDARDAFINAAVDVFGAFKVAQNLPQTSGQLTAPQNLMLLPLYTLALLKHPAFRTGTSTRLDDRVFSMCEMKTLPLDQLIRLVYSDFYQLDCLFYTQHSASGTVETDNEQKAQPPRLQLSAERLDSRSIFLLDTGPTMLLYIGTNVPSNLVQSILNVNSVQEIPDACYELPATGTPASETLHTFLDQINEEKPFAASVQIIRDTSSFRPLFTEKLIEDRSESSVSYYEFLQHLRTQVK